MNTMESPIVLETLSMSNRGEIHVHITFAASLHIYSQS